MLDHHTSKSFHRVAISMACRLRFCRKLDGEDGLGSPSASLGAASGQLEALDLDAMLRCAVVAESTLGSCSRCRT
jgi:hypothetical protein